MRILLAVAYPVLAHWAVASRGVWVTAASLAALILLMAWPKLASRSAVVWGLLPVAGVGLFLLARTEAAWLPLYAAPMLISGFAAWVFGHTLEAGRMPLIERLARLLHEPEGISDEIARYARKVTLAWTIFLSALTLSNFILALLAAPDGILLMAGMQPAVTVPVEIWSLFANFLNYVIAAGFFLAEYLYRKRRFPEQPYRNLFDFVKRASRLGTRAMRDTWS